MSHVPILPNKIFQLVLTKQSILRNEIRTDISMLLFSINTKNLLLLTYFFFVSIVATKLGSIFSGVGKSLYYINNEGRAKYDFIIIPKFSRIKALEILLGIHKTLYSTIEHSLFVETANILQLYNIWYLILQGIPNQFY